MRKVFASLGIVIVLLAVLAYSYRDEVVRAVFAASLFRGVEQYDNFNRVADLFPTTTMTASTRPYRFPKGAPANLPSTFVYKGRQTDVDDFLALTDTAALLVLKDGAMVHEQYRLTGGPDVNWLSMSVAKSFLSTGIGIAVDEGLIDIHKTMEAYVPLLAGSAYDGVRIKDVLQMSSGAAWDETYSDPGSEINRLGRVLALGGSTSEFVAGMQREFEPGTVNRYNSADTQALGLLLTHATGKSITAYLTEKIWHPLGMENDAYWIIDSENVEMAFFGLNATARDYSKLGELFRNHGEWRGERIVAASWVRDATTPDAPHVMPKPDSDYPFGYGYQWWVPQGSEGEFMAIGVYNQFIYVNPSRGVVITKLSAFSDYATSDDETAYREVESLALFRAIARSLEPAKRTPSNPASANSRVPGAGTCCIPRFTSTATRSAMSAVPSRVNRPSETPRSPAEVPIASAHIPSVEPVVSCSEPSRMSSPETAGKAEPATSVVGKKPESSKNGAATVAPV